MMSEAVAGAAGGLSWDNGLRPYQAAAV